jgi:hypothetical protein
MNNDEKIIEQAIDALKQEQIPAGPSEELVAVTSRRIETISNLTAPALVSRKFQISNLSFWVKIAAAAILLITAGYISGRLSVPKSQDVDAIRQQLLSEMNQNLQTALANSYLLLRDELADQYQQDINDTTEQLVTVFAAALEQIEQNRIIDVDTLGSALVNFALQTDKELQRTQQGVVEIAKLLSYSQSENLIPYEPENINNSN